MFATLRSIAEERFETELICLSEQPSLVDDPRTVRVAKPPPDATVTPPAGVAAVVEFTRMAPLATDTGAAPSAFAFV